MSEQTVVQKLRIKSGQVFLLLSAPQGYRASLGDLPASVTVITEPGEPADVIQCFVTSRAELEDLLPGLKEVLKPRGILWVAYPKTTSRIASDVNRDVIRAYAPSIGLEAVALFAVDQDWASLRLKVV